MDEKYYSAFTSSRKAPVISWTKVVWEEISSVLAAMVATFSVISFIRFTSSSMEVMLPATLGRIASAFSLFWDSSILVESESCLISSATTANPRPCYPARAASMEAFSDRRLVWPAMEEISALLCLYTLIKSEIVPRDSFSSLHRLEMD